MYASIAAAAGYWSIDPQGLSSSHLPKMKRTASNRPKRQAVFQSAKGNVFGSMIKGQCAVVFYAHSQGQGATWDFFPRAACE